MRSTFVALGALLFAAPAAAQPTLSAPQPAAMPPAVAAPQDKPYPGVMKLAVDATDIERHIFRVRQTIPVAAPGPMTLLYPQWLPGNHAPRGPIKDLAGLIVTAGGQRIAWRRDPVDVYAFHLDVPAGAAEIELEFQFLSPTSPEQGRVVVTPEMLNLQWNQMALYPAGYYTRQIMVEPSVRLPDGWSYGVALDTASNAGGVATFKPVSFETLVDSPMFAGRWFKRIELDPGGRSRVSLNIVADAPENLEATPAQIAAHRALVVQSDKLFGTRHFDRYDFLLALTDRLGGIGLEHHRSSENSVDPGYFTNWDSLAPERDLLPHEYAHSWNGKFRRPADLWTPTYSTPMRNSLLWVYEGQTQYWGYVLSARSGLLSRQQTLDALAMTAALYDVRVGRAWRPMGDTVNDPIIASRRPIPWNSWQRSEDYYSEGQLIWLDVDTLIREKTSGRRSLDDFAKAFFGGAEGDWGVRPYDFDEVVATLSRVVAHDWASFLKTRLEGHGPGAPLDGLARGGYRLVYTDAPTDYFRETEAGRKITDLTYSIGVVLGREGDLRNVHWEGPAFKAGLSIGDRIVAVNGLAFDVERLKSAITAAKGQTRPIELIVRSGERFRTVSVAYDGGLRYPRLERVPGAPDRLGDILEARR
jgi:predicted metalloprotease with PDZ domain